MAIGSEGVIGDKLVNILQGTANAPRAKEGQLLGSTEPVETDAIIASLEVTANNAEIITQQLAEIMTKINNGKGTIGRLIEDKTIADNLNKTIINLRNGSKGLDDNMTAAKHNFLLRGYFKKQEKQKAEQKEEAKEKLEDAKKEQIKKQEKARKEKAKAQEKAQKEAQKEAKK